jgi:hypothetical protein
MTQLPFWGEKLQWKLNGDLTDDGDKVVRVNGNHYVLAADTGNFKGHGGREFDVEFTDGPHKGERMKCRNVWAQGKIPEDYKDVLPDNAVFHWNTKSILAQEVNS